MKRESKAREERLASILSRASHREWLTALPLLGVALSRDQAVQISKIVAAKLSTLGFGKASTSRATSLDPAANPADGTRSQQPATEGATQEGNGQKSQSSSQPPPKVSSSLSSPQPPMAAGASAVHDTVGSSCGGEKAGEVSSRPVAKRDEGTYIGVVEVEMGWAAHVMVEGVDLHLGIFPTPQVAR